MSSHSDFEPLLPETSPALRLPFMALREVVMFPQAIIPLFVGRAPSVKAIEESIAHYDKKIFLVVQKEADKEKAEAEDLFPMGVVSRILQMMHMPDGTIKVLFEGLYRATWSEIPQGQALEALEVLENEEGNCIENDREEQKVKTFDFPCIDTYEIKENHYTNPELEALCRVAHKEIEAFAEVNKKLTPEHLSLMQSLADAGLLADAIMPHLNREFTEKQAILEMLNVGERLEAVLGLLAGESEIAEIEKVIQNRVKSQIERSQREYYLNEQIKAIHKELGTEDPNEEVNEFEARFREKDMPEEARERGLRELRKIRSMGQVSAEYTIARTYIEWLLDLPWNALKEIDIDINKASQVLDNAHFGLKKPKERILEYLAVQKITQGLKGPILCLVGPPGVGKTSLAKSVAEATDREFVRISLGGVRDEAEIRGHRRTYIGAMPGKIIMALKKAHSSNPLFCLDEIDKMTSDFRGDPSAALLEVLDPEQNNTFVDHYLDLDYDLSKVFFIMTANSIQEIPVPLLDRMEVIELSSYLETEKLHIAEDFLLPKQLKEHGLTDKKLSVSKDALIEIIRHYTREAGVRNLERQVAKLCRKVAMAFVADNKESAGNLCLENSCLGDSCPDGSCIENPCLGNICQNTSDTSLESISLDKADLEQYLGVHKYTFGEREKEAQIGVSTGLAYNSVGGDILHIETAIMHGVGKVECTGQLGSVMQESAKTAFSYIRSRASLFGLKPDFYKEIDVHVHVPEGATPKDGPSAGITMTTSIVSALTGLPVLSSLAMTGEITLRGRVLAIGGLREKLLAAGRSSIKTVLVPKENQKDIKEIPEDILENLEIIFVEHMDEVLPYAFGLEADKVYSRSTYEMDFVQNLRKAIDHSIQ